MHEVEPSVAEGKRAMKELGAKGIQLFTNVNGKPIDSKEYEPLFALAAEHRLPIWLHPTRTADFPDYTTENSRAMRCGGASAGLNETSVAMARLVLTRHLRPLSRDQDHHPSRRCMIPFYDKRIQNGLASLGGRTKEEDYSGVLSALKRPFMDYFPRILRRYGALR